MFPVHFTLTGALGAALAEVADGCHAVGARDLLARQRVALEFAVVAATLEARVPRAVRLPRRAARKRLTVVTAFCKHTWALVVFWCVFFENFPSENCVLMRSVAEMRGSTNHWVGFGVRSLSVGWVREEKIREGVMDVTSFVIFWWASNSSHAANE